MRLHTTVVLVTALFDALGEETTGDMRATFTTGTHGAVITIVFALLHPATSSLGAGFWIAAALDAMISQTLASALTAVFAIRLRRSIVAAVHAILEERPHAFLTGFAIETSFSTTLSQCLCVLCTALRTGRRIGTLACTNATVSCFTRDLAATFLVTTLGNTLLKNSLPDVPTLIATSRRRIVTALQTALEESRGLLTTFARLTSITKTLVEGRARVLLAAVLTGRRRRRLPTVLETVLQRALSLGLTIDVVITTVDRNHTITPHSETSFHDGPGMVLTTIFTTRRLGTFALFFDTCVVNAPGTCRTNVRITTFVQTIFLRRDGLSLASVLTSRRGRGRLTILQTFLEMNFQLVATFFDTFDVVVGEIGDTPPEGFMDCVTAAIGTGQGRNVLTALKTVVEKALGIVPTFLRLSAVLQTIVHDCLRLAETGPAAIRLRGPRIGIAVQQTVVQNGTTLTLTLLGITPFGDTVPNRRRRASLAKLLATRRNRTIGTIPHTSLVRRQMLPRALFRVASVRNASADSPLGLDLAFFLASDRRRPITTSATIGQERADHPAAVAIAVSPFGTFATNAPGHGLTGFVAILGNGNRIRYRSRSITAGEHFITNACTLGLREVALTATLVRAASDSLAVIGTDNDISLGIDRQSKQPRTDNSTEK